MNPPIEYHVEDSIGLLRVNRPAARNALNWEAQEAFAAAVERAAVDPSLRILIITGAGDQAFISGADLKELSRHPEAAAGERLNRTMSRALAMLGELPLPVIGVANGDALGGGCEVLTACDLRIAAASARFAFRQVHNGLTSGWGGAARLVPLIGQSRAMELMLSGRVIDAAEAQQIGFIHRVVEPGRPILEAAEAWAHELLPLPRRALAAVKALVAAAAHQPASAVNRLEAQAFVELWTTADHLEAMRAFTEKRPPIFNQGDTHDRL